MPKALAVGVEDTGGNFKRLTVDIRDVGPKDVAIKVLYCGVCHSDLHQVRGEWNQTNRYPMVPGHEVVGVVEAVGPNVTRFKLGDRVGVGCMVDSCRTCDYCKLGEEQYCKAGNTPTYNGKKDGKLTFGGYSSNMVVDQDFVLRIPDGADLAKAAPLLCAGITTYSPLSFFGAKEAGSKFTVGVHGFGGLGHMAVKIALAMGNKVVVISRGTGKKAYAEKLGADFVDGTDKLSLKKWKGSLDLIISTVSGEFNGWNDVLRLVKTNGKLVLVGAPPKPIPIEAFAVIGGRRSFAGSSIGGITETQEMLDFCAKHNIYPEITILPASEATKIHCSLFEGQGDTFRFVIDIANTLTEKTEVTPDPRLAKQSWITQGTFEPPEANKHKHAVVEEPSHHHSGKKSYTHTALFCIVLTGLAVGAGYLLGRRK